MSENSHTTEEQKNIYKASEMKKILQTAEMALWLDGYDDIFSDFDPRPYSQRAISDDFLLEVMKVAKDRGKDNYELKFLLAPETRNYSHEQVIKERLHHLFGIKYHSLLKEKKGVLNYGIIFVLSGIFLMFLGAFFKSTITNNQFLSNFLVVLTEPAGWFLFWEGLARAMNETKLINPKIGFYSKMSRSKISFISY